MSPTGAESDLSPSQRLAISRERMREAMRPPPVRDRADARGLVAGLRARLRGYPAAGLVLEVIESWWRRHPMRSAALIAGEASRAVVAPLAQRKPVQFILLAFLGGVALAWLKPWRWFGRKRLFAGLLPQIVSRVVASIPTASWLAILASFTGRPPTRDGGTPARPPES
ncbi:MAG: hypothetical protein JSR59_22010 [Proteobacteria bacterium]|nr:hypothetical protein [Pseudomonadota bacterium]